MCVASGGDVKVCSVVVIIIIKRIQERLLLDGLASVLLVLLVLVESLLLRQLSVTQTAALCGVSPFLGVAIYLCS